VGQALAHRRSGGQSVGGLSATRPLRLLRQSDHCRWHRRSTSRDASDWRYRQYSSHGGAYDGGFLNALMVNPDGQPVPDTRVHIFPAQEISPAILAQSRSTALCGQTGMFSSGTLPPGKYYVLASNSPVENTPESIARLWEARKKTRKVEVTCWRNSPSHRGAGDDRVTQRHLFPNEQASGPTLHG
jgi:hypothetical protein